MTAPFTPGLHADISAEDYHDLPALSAGGAWMLVEECPQKMWFNSPMNPGYAPKRERKFDVATAAHCAMLEPDEFANRTAVIDADDYRTKDAKAKRDEAYSLGKTPLLVGQLDQVKAIRAAILAHPLASKAFTAGKPEQTLLWRDPETQIPCKARPDWLRDGFAYMADLKAQHTANPREWPRTAFGLGYHLRAAWYLDGCEIVTGKRPEHYWFVVVEREPPHCISVFQLDERAIEWGRLFARRAIQILAKCIERDECPGYRDPQHPDRDRAFTVSIPTFGEYQLHERHEAGEFKSEKIPKDLLERARLMQAPL